jgi:hypothetical protein
MEVTRQRHAPAALYPHGKGERTPHRTHCTGGWVDPRAGLETEVRGKILCLCRGSKLDRPVVQSAVRSISFTRICHTVWIYLEFENIDKRNVPSVYQLLKLIIHGFSAVGEKGKYEHLHFFLVSLT